MGNKSPLSRYSAADRIIDELLVLHILSGDAGAMDRLGVRWHSRLLRVARYITGNEELAEIAAQETWIGICRNWRQLTDASKFSSWAFGILRHKCLDAARMAIRYDQRRVVIERTAQTSMPARGQMQLELSDAFDVLSPTHRTAAILYFGEELTLAEVAAVLDRPLGTIQSRIFHARRQLKAALEGD